MFQQQRWCESWGVRNAVQHAAVESGTCQFSPAHKSSREGMLLLQLKHTPAHSSPLVWWDGRQIKRSRTRTEQLPCCTVLRQFLSTAESPSLYSRVFSFSTLCSACRKLTATHVCLYSHVYSMCFLLFFCWGFFSLIGKKMKNKVNLLQSPGFMTCSVWYIF